MKVLFINTYIHHKNLNFILKCKKITFHSINSVKLIYNLNLSEFDAVFCPSDPVDVSKFPNTVFIFGPHFSVFPDNKLISIKGINSVYNSLSEWVVNCWKLYPICTDLKFISLPFGVDTEKFCNIKPITERNNVIVYFKNRDPSELQKIVYFLGNKNIKYTLFSYKNKYDEKTYLECLQNAKYCIWVGRHESQGFALQEALSCDVPLLIWNVTSMNQEIGYNYSDIPATVVPYWDERCGEIFYNFSEFENVYKKFIENIENYKPREFILNNLSIEVCENKWIETIKNMQEKIC